MTDWTQERLASRPDEFSPISAETVIQRRNVEKKEHEAKDGQPAFTEYICESRVLSYTEYQAVVSQAADSRLSDIEAAISDMIGGTA